MGIRKLVFKWVNAPISGIPRVFEPKACKNMAFAGATIARTVATLALIVRRSNHSARSQHKKSLFHLAVLACD
jgi:hypothetical protein